MKTPRILVIENSLDITGALTSVLRSAEGLSSSFEFIFILPEKSKASDYVRESGFEVYEFPMRELRKSFSSFLTYTPALIRNVLRLRRLAEYLKVSLIHNNDFYNLLPAAYKIMGGDVNYVCQVRFLPNRFPSLLVKLWCSCHEKYAEQIIAVSEVVKKQIAAYKKVIVIPNELPLNDQEQYVSSTSKIILYPANYTKGKGQEHALESFACVAKKFPDWKLRFIGSDMGLEKNAAFKKWLVQQADELEIADQVEWLPSTTNLGEQYKGSAFMLNFSESESFSMTCLESLYYGRTVIATRSGGPAEIIDRDSGVLVPLADIQAMAREIERMIAEPSRREMLSARGFDLVREKFSFDNTIGRMGSVYNAVLGKK